MKSRNQKLALLALISFSAVFVLSVSFAFAAAAYGSGNYSAGSYGTDTTKPNVNLTLAKSTIDVDEKMNITCSGTDSGGMRNVTLVQGGAQLCTHPTSCQFQFSQGISGTYTVDCISRDINDLLNSTTGTITVNDPTKGSGSGGGGGGASTASSQTVSVFRVLPGVTTEIKFNSDVAEISKISLEVNNEVSSVSVKVENVGTAPPAGTSSASSKVYKYIEITAPKITATEFKAATIEFNVDKSWLKDNKLKENEVALFRYSGGQWNKLDTTLVTSGFFTLAYKATTPGFSTFAIGSTKAEAAPAPTTEAPAETPAEQPTQQETTTTTGAKPASSMTTIWILVAIALVLGGAYYFYTTKMKK